MTIGSIGTRTQFWEMNVAKSDLQGSVGQLDKIWRWNPLLPFHNVRHARLYEKIPGHIEGLMQCRRIAWQALKLIGDARSAKADCSLRKAVRFGHWTTAGALRCLWCRSSCRGSRVRRTRSSSLSKFSRAGLAGSGGGGGGGGAKGDGAVYMSRRRGGKGKPDQGRSHFCLRPHSSPTVVRPLSAPPPVLAPPFS